MDCRPLSLADALEICSWRYPAPYDVYDMPDWSAVCRQNWGIASEETRREEFYAVTENEKLTGFFRFQRRGDALTVGLGLCPDACGRGLGGPLMALIAREARRRFGHGTLILIVRSFNRRAIACYRRAGWAAGETVKKQTPSGEASFLTMTCSF